MELFAACASVIESAGRIYRLRPWSETQRASGIGKEASRSRFERRLAFPSDAKIQDLTLRQPCSRAFYQPSNDWIRIPEKERFDSPEEYYSTLFHEFTHSTGHKTRLNRPGIVEEHSFGDEIYSKEELVAEMGAAMLCGVVGIENKTINNSASYIKTWFGRLKEDKRLVVHAAAVILWRSSDCRTEAEQR
jgi:hypothetical protein